MHLPETLLPYVAGGVAAALTYAVVRRQTARNSLPLPPGPKPLPVLGNLFDIPREKEWLKYREWNERYGDVVYLEALGLRIVILGSASAVNDLMEKRSVVYSDRPNATMMGMMDMGWILVMLPYGDAWRRARKLFHAHVHQAAAHRYYPVQIDSARRFARDILSVKTDNEALSEAIRVSLGRSIIQMVYGIDVQDADSEYLSLPARVVASINEAATPGRFVVDFLPILKYVPAWFPGAGFHNFAARARADSRRVRDKPLEVVTAAMANGTAPPSMARAMLEEASALPAEQSHVETIKGLAGVTYLAGSDTTVAAVISFFLAMLVYPDVQAKAQAEVDRVVGRDRLPEIEDAESLPYVQAIASECLRWLPVFPMSVPRTANQDDEYNGYLIPKGTAVMASSWAILHNPEDYPEPEIFKPERYLTPDGKLDSNVRDPRTACFGFGRRICPGRYIADASLFATISTLLATIDIVRAKDANGNEIVPEVDVTSGAISHAKPFAWAVRPRNRQAEELIGSALAH